MTLGWGAWHARSASEDATSFFAARRELPWWLAGTSIVATTFAADTPLAITGLVATDGIAGNWLWWADVLPLAGIGIRPWLDVAAATLGIYAAIAGVGWLLFGELTRGFAASILAAVLLFYAVQGASTGASAVRGIHPDRSLQ